jgi:hypothetical protein
VRNFHASGGQIEGLNLSRWTFGVRLSELESCICNHQFVKLGGNISCILALGPQLTRLGLCFNGLEDPAVVDLQEWLSTVHKPQPVTT